MNSVLASAVIIATSTTPYATIEGWNPAWNGFISEGIDKNVALLDSSYIRNQDVNNLCPGIVNATDQEKKVFWATVIAGVAKYESGFDPDARYLEKNGRWSEGLLQLNYDDVTVKAWHPCEFDRKQRNTTDPKTNLMCGVSILRAQMGHRKKLFHPPGERPYYWAVLKKYREKVRSFYVEHSEQLPFCKPNSWLKKFS